MTKMGKTRGYSGATVVPPWCPRGVKKVVNPMIATGVGIPAGENKSQFMTTFREINKNSENPTFYDFFLSGQNVKNGPSLLLTFQDLVKNERNKW